MRRPATSPQTRHRTRLFLTAALTTALLAAAAPARASLPPPVPPRAFTLMVVPDPQGYTRSDALATTYRKQMRWIARSAGRLNTRLVISVGDLVQTVDSETHWARADEAWGVLDGARVPYSVVPGNHDMTSGGVAQLYDRMFPPRRHASQATYGGYLGDPSDAIPDPVNRRNKDSYHLVSWKGVKLVVISLEVDLPIYAVEWAQSVIDAFPRRHVVLVTHRWLRDDGTRWERTYYRTDTDLLTPEETWERLVRPNCRVFMVLAGHEDTETRRTDRNRCGRRVFQLLANYQDRPNGGDGWLRYYTFRPGNDRIAASTYSVTLRNGKGQMERDAESRFRLPWKH